MAETNLDLKRREQDLTKSAKRSNRSGRDQLSGYHGSTQTHNTDIFTLLAVAPADSRSDGKIP